MFLVEKEEQTGTLTKKSGVLDGSEIRLTTWNVRALVNNRINYQPQLVQDFFHEQYHGKFEGIPPPLRRPQMWDMSWGTMALGEGRPSKSMSVSKKSPTGPTDQTPKPEYLIALATYLGVRW